jgi:tRNA threonylcarbamoyl adenosine modification protein YeaZ
LVFVLVLDTSTAAVTAGLTAVDSAGVVVLAQRVTVDARAHGELLAPAIGSITAEAGLTPMDLRAIVAGVGPGPFTGLRVGLVTAAAMGQALGVPTYGVCSLDAIGALTTGTVLVATDARRKEVYWAVYDKAARVTEPAVARPAAVAAHLSELGMIPDTAVGEGAAKYHTELLVGGNPLAVAEEPRFPAPGALAELAADRIRSLAPSEPLTPMYLRRPDAVEPGARKSVRQDDRGH